MKIHISKNNLKVQNHCSKLCTKGPWCEKQVFLVGQHPKPFNNFFEFGCAPMVLNTQKNYDTAKIVKNVSVHKLRDSLFLKSTIVYDNLKKNRKRVICMNIIKYNKLVRDRIPEIIEESGKTCKTEILNDEEYLRMIDAKLDEELAEYHKDQNIEELADLMEVIYAAARHVDIPSSSWSRFARRRQKSAADSRRRFCW